MSNSKKFPGTLCFLFIFLFGSSPFSYAFTGKEMIESFSVGDRFVYVTGLVDMAAYQAALDNDNRRAQCILDWFHTSDRAAMREVEHLFVNYEDKHAEPLVVVLINRACGKPGE